MVTATQLHAAASAVLEAVGEQRGPALSERELLQLAIAFANEGKLGGPLVLPALLGDGLGLVLRSESEAIAGESGRAAELREQLRSDLAAAMNPKLPSSIADRLRQASSRMVATPSFDVTRVVVGRRSLRGLRARWYYVPTTLEAILAYAVLLLRDETLGLGADLKRCQLESCGQFFFSSDRSAPKGKPRTLYCTDEHMLEARAGTRAEYMRQWRKHRTKHK